MEWNAGVGGIGTFLNLYFQHRRTTKTIAGPFEDSARVRPDRVDANHVPHRSVGLGRRTRVGLARILRAVLLAVLRCCRADSLAVLVRDGAHAFADSVLAGSQRSLALGDGGRHFGTMACGLSLIGRRYSRSGLLSRGRREVDGGDSQAAAGGDADESSDQGQGQLGRRDESKS